MEFLGFILLFFLSSFSAYAVKVAHAQGRFNFRVVTLMMFWAVLIGGIYFLGWWALLVFLVGYSVGHAAFVRALNTGRL